MSVAIRLSRAGRVHLPHYHIGVFDSRTRRDGRPVEELGFYDPGSDKEAVRIDVERARRWLAVGAKPSATVAAILKGQGVKPEEWAAKRKKAARKGAAKKTAAKKGAVAGSGRRRKHRTRNSKARGERGRQAAG